MGLLAKFSDLVSRSTGLVLLFSAALTLLAVTQLVDLQTGHFRLEIDPSANRLLSEHNPAKQFYDQARRMFGSDEILVITLTSPDVFTPDTLKRIDRMTRRISDVEAVDHVVSLTNAVDIRSVDGGLDIAPFIDNLGQGPEAIKTIRQRVLDNPVYSGSLVSKSGDATALVVYFRDIDDREFIRRGIHDKIVAIVNEEKGDNEIWITGTPHFKVSVIKILMHDLLWMPPLIALILALVLIVCYRTVLGVIVPLVTVAVGVVLSLGIIAALGYSLSMISVLVPPLLMILGLSYSVHVVSEYQQHRQETPDKTVLVRNTLKRILLPVMLTGVTTIAGFASMVVNPIEAISEFGELSVIGVIVITLVSVTFTPALLRFLDRTPPVAASTKPVHPSLFDRFIDRVAVFDLKYKNTIFLFSGVLFALGLAGLLRMHVSADIMTSFSKDSEVRTSFELVNEKLGGANPLYIVIDGGRPDAFKEPANLNTIRELQSWLNQQPEIGGSVSIADYIMLVNRALHDNDPAFYAIPDNRRLITQLLFLSSSDELNRIVDNRFQNANVIVRTRVISSDDMATLINRINARLAELPDHLKAQATGNPVLITQTLTEIITGQAKSVGLALLIVYAILSLMFMSYRIGFIALIPNVLPIVIYFGSLGFFGISLNPSTSLIAPMVLGIAIDDTIHYFARFNREVRRLADDGKATVEALKGVGRPMTYTSVALCLGFLALTTSELSMQVQVGLMASWALAVAWLCDFLLTPALCSSVRITTLWDVLTLDLGENPQDSIPLLNGLRKSQARIVALMSKVISVPAGTRIITDGEKGEEMYVVIDGKLRTSIAGGERRIELATHTRGDVVGEAGLFYEKRTADVDTLEDTRLLCLSQDNLERLSRRYPYIATKVFRNLNRVLATRLFTTTHRLTT
jgi:predicted RND superfamily exporter protein